MNQENQTDRNAQWAECKRCGEPLLIDPDTGQTEACAACQTASSPAAVSTGVVMILAGLALVTGIVVFGLVIIL